MIYIYILYIYTRKKPVQTCTPAPANLECLPPCLLAPANLQALPPATDNLQGQPAPQTCTPAPATLVCLPPCPLAPANLESPATCACN